jgi:hypothetical protein
MTYILIISFLVLILNFIDTNALTTKKFDTRISLSTVISTPSLRSSTALYYRTEKVGDNDNDNNENSEGLWQGIKRFLPNIVRAKLENKRDEMQTDTSLRYQIRLRDTDLNHRRHIISRICKYFPDISWPYAEDIFETAQNNPEGMALIRRMGNLVSLISLKCF